MIKEINKVGIVGAGKMGTGIFNYLMDFGFELTLVSSPGSDVDKINRQFDKKIRRSLDAGIINPARFELLERTVISRDLNSLSDCDLIIEALPELKTLKRELLSSLDKCIKEDAIFATNSSSFNPSELSPPGHRVFTTVGLHFFYPVQLKNIVELTVTSRTFDETILVIESFLDRINRRHIKLGEDCSFILNRIMLDVQNEAFLFVDAGRCTYRQMDQMVKENLFPFGIFDFFDSVGLDTMLTSVKNYTRSYPRYFHYEPLINVLDDLVSKGRLGVRTQAGFYDYPLEIVPVKDSYYKEQIIQQLREVWIESAGNFATAANISPEDANFAIREYFDIPAWPPG
jgi:3-hydroxybutyryl-CoA dehydrogenase